jgi:uncharacterized protein (DUF952 family)
VSEHLFHIIEPAVWASVADEYRPQSLAEDGFIHFSFVGQVDGVANSLYGDAGELYVLEVDPAQLPGEIRVEDSYNSGVEFPHLYGPLPVAAVLGVHPLPRGVDGRFTFGASGRA